MRGPVVLTALLGLALACRGTAPVSDELPGAEPFPAELARRLAAAVAARGSHDAPHTRHLRPDGTARFTNRLVLETSPYLLQHAHNPVNWYPWGEDAFATARRESKPVLLSVGYSTCHWCHVMEDESFENDDIAEYLNRNYIAIKVDREVRPDVDEVYMHVVQLLSGGGGWPMTVWLTPSREAFGGGTYFPPGPFLAALKRARELFDSDPMQVVEQAEQITKVLQQMAAPSDAEALPGAEALRAAYDHFVADFDGTNGGFGDAPKFPSPPELDFLLRYQRRTGSAEARHMVELTLERMAAGGIHDQVGGGFHRYATDARWQIPHFEKMLYDNAQLATLYLAAWQVTGRDDFAAVVRDVLDYLARDMSAADGGFWAASDADSEGEEGKFFTWTPAEVRGALDAPHAAAALAWWDVTEHGDFHGRNVLHVARPADDVARALGIEPGELARLVDESRPALRTARARRVPPHTDTKVLAAWNGLAISAFARAGAALDEPRWVERAVAAARFVLDRIRIDGVLQRTFADGRAGDVAFLDDYAYLVAGLLDLYEATFDLGVLRDAIALADELTTAFRDDADGAFFLTPAGHDAPLVREKPWSDGVLPSGNAVAALDLFRLAELTGDERYRERATGVLGALAHRLESPAATPALLAALDFQLDRPKEIVIVVPSSGDDGGLGRVAARAYVPNRMLTVATEGRTVARQQEVIPVVAEKHALGGRATAYVCERRVCELPTTDPAVLAAQLRKVAPLEDTP